MKITKKSSKKIQKLKKNKKMNIIYNKLTTDIQMIKNKIFKLKI